MSAIRALAATSTHYRGLPDTFVRAVEEVLRVDVRSKDQTKRWATLPTTEIVIDNAHIEYSVAFPGVVTASSSSDLSSANAGGHHPNAGETLLDVGERTRQSPRAHISILTVEEHM